MKFHSFHWSNFLESSAGQASVAFFSNLRELYATADPALRQFLERWAHAGLLGALLDTDTQIASVHAAFESLAEVDKHGLVPSAKLDTTEGARAYFEAIAYISVSPEDAPDKIWPLFEIGDVSALSVALYCLHPDFFFPYYFYPRFHCLVAIFESSASTCRPCRPSDTMTRASCITRSSASRSRSSRSATKSSRA